jgi:hypothetical protein
MTENTKMVTVVAPPDDDHPTQGIKTLEATFVPPTAHKEEKLNVLYEEYQVGTRRSPPGRRR